MNRRWKTISILTLALAVVMGRRAAAQDAAPNFDPATFAQSLQDCHNNNTIETLHKIVVNQRKDAKFITLSADGTRMVASYDNNHIVVWDTATAKRVGPAKLNMPGEITSLAVSSDGKLFLAGRKAHNAILGSTSEIKVVNVMKGMSSPAQFAAIVDDDKTAVLIEENGSMHRYPLLAGDGEHIQIPAGKKYMSFSVSADGKYATLCEESQKLLNIVELGAEKPGPKSSGVSTRYIPSHSAVTRRYVAFSMGDGQLTFKSMGDDKDLPFVATHFVTSPQWLLTTPDGGTLLLLNSEGYLDVHDVAAPGISRRWKLPTKSPLHSASLAADGRTLAVSGYGGEVNLFRLPKLAESPAIVALRKMSQLLAEKKYDDLDALFKHFETAHEPFPWAMNQTPYAALIELLAAPSCAIWDWEKSEQAIEAWQMAKPNSAPAKIARTLIYIRHAWESRGNDIASKVTETGWQGFRTYIAQARLLMLPLCEGERPPPQALAMLFVIAMAESWGPHEWAPYADKLLKHAPLYGDAHFTLAQKLMTRWGGEPDSLALYAAKVADTIGGPAGDGVYARIAVSQHQYYPPEMFFRHSGLDFDRTMRGFEHLAATAPDRHAMAYMGIWLSLAGDPVKANKLVEHVKEVDVRIEWPLALAKNPGSLGRVHKRVAAGAVAEPPKPRDDQKAEQ